MEPDLADLIDLWLKENASSYYVDRSADDKPANILGWIYYRGFGSCVTIYRDHINISLDQRDPDGLTIMAADPKLFPLLSNRLYILEQGFVKALDSRVETARRDLEKEKL